MKQLLWYCLTSDFFFWGGGGRSSDLSQKQLLSLNLSYIKSLCFWPLNGHTWNLFLSSLWFVIHKVSLFLALLLCLHTPLTLVCGGSPIIPLLVHQPAYLSICPAAPSLQRGLSTNPGVTVCCVCGCSWRDGVCRVCGCCRGGIVVMDVIWRRLCVSMIWGREICLFWVGQGCDNWGREVSSELLMCGCCCSPSETYGRKWGYSIHTLSLFLSSYWSYINSLCFLPLIFQYINSLRFLPLNGHT